MGDKTLTPKDEKAAEGGTGSSHSFVAKYYKKYLLEVEDVHFHTNSAVLLPEQITDAESEKPADAKKPADPDDHVDTVSGLGVIAATYDHAKANSSHKILVAGHTDTTATVSFNLELSRLRAENVHAVLKGDADGWAAICKKRHRPEDYHHILWWIATAFLWDCHPASISETDTPKTVEAVKSFQKIYKETVDDTLKVDGAVGEQTWKAIFYMYMWRLKNLMNVDDAGLQARRDSLKFVNDKLHAVGCSEHFPIDHAELDSYRSTRNRRVEILFFEAGEEPKLDCHPEPKICQPRVCLIYQKKGYKTVPVVIKPTKQPKKFLTVALQLQYKDPEGNARAFPADFPVIVEYLNGDHVDPTPRTTKKGILEFEADKSKTSFTLRFERTKGAVYFSSPQGGSGEEDGFVGDAGLEEAWLEGKRLMRMPGLQADEEEGATWGMKESDWLESDAKTKFDESKFGSLSAKSDGDIGKAGAPMQLLLDPHWQFARFMFFDRYYGHSDHDNKQIAAPAIPLEGFRAKPSTPEAPSDTLSTWMYKGDDADTACQALPWILQRDAEGNELPKLDHDMVLRFRTLHGDSVDSESKVAFVISDSASTREIKILDSSVPEDQARLSPNAERLRCYDLPTVWKSKNYYTRLSATTGKFFDELTQDELANSFDASKRLAFSLDDILIMVSNPLLAPDPAAPAPRFIPFSFKPQPSYTAPLKKPPIDTWNRIALFSHRFDGADDALFSPAGLFRPDSDVANVSKLEGSGAGHEMYIKDYANWTRLIIAQGNLFDVFDMRSPDTTDDKVAVGARAAVRWAESPEIHPGDEVTSAPLIRTRDYFAIQHFFRHSYPWRGEVFSLSHHYTIGRFDIALFRCCDVVDGKEVAVNLHYIKSYFHFAADPATDATMDADGRPHVSKADYIKQLIANVDKRWNGFEAGSANPAKLMPSEDSLKLSINAVWFGQSLDHDWCHFKVDVESHKDADGNYGRDNRGGFYGTGVSKTSSYKDWGNINGFATAHESGHANSLPDEYNERWDAASFGKLSFQGNLPGDPYELDGRSPVGAKSSDTGMMNGNHKIRNRYFWHAAEWCRRVLGDPPFKLYTEWLMVKWDTYEKYRVPPHSDKRFTYAYWPINYSIDYSASGRGDVDLLLYTLGADKYSTSILAKGKGPFKGILMHLVKIKLFMHSDDENVIEEFLDEITKVVDELYNEKFYVTGKFGAGTNVEWEFTEGEKCLMQFSPRFLVKRPSTPDYTGKGSTFLNAKAKSKNKVEKEAVTVVNLTANFTKRFDVEVEKYSVKTTSDLKWVNPSPDRALKLDFSTSILAKSWKVQIRGFMKSRFREMLGLAAGTEPVKPEQLLPLVQQVVTSDAKVSSF